MITTIVLVIGFCSALTSDARDHRIFAMMGILTISSALFADLFFLPALLLLVCTQQRTKQLGDGCVMADWYDYPQYFDMVFRDETQAETDFFLDAFDRYLTQKPKRLLEPGCGSGRLVVALAAEGFEVTGLDLSEPMLRYLRNRLRRRDLKADAVIGDMTSMNLKTQYDARLLHLQYVSSSVDRKRRRGASKVRGRSLIDRWDLHFGFPH